MKSENRRAKKFFLTGALLLFGLSVGSVAADAQTTKQKTRRAARQPVVILPPVPQQQTEPEIVSRAGDETQNQIFVQPAPQNQTVSTPVETADSEMKDLRKRVKSLESTRKNEYDEKQKRLLLNLDILTRAETRSESLRKQLFDTIEKESSIKTRIEQLENDSRPEMLDRSVAFAGSLRPEEIRDARRKNMASEKQNLQNLLTGIQSSRASLEANVERADCLVEKLRFKLEKDIDDALTEEPK